MIENKDKVLAVRLSSKELEGLRRLAMEEDRPISQMARRILVTHIDQQLSKSKKSSN